MRLRIVTLAGDPEREADLATRLTTRDSVELYLRCVDRVELLACLQTGDLDAVVSVGAPSWFDRAAAAQAVAQGTRIVGLADNALEAECLRELGAVVLDPALSVDEILDVARRTPPPPPPDGHGGASPPPESHGRLVSVWGPKGSPGRTALAIELAWHMTPANPATLLVDGDPYGGDVQQLLGMVEELPTVAWAAHLASKGELGGSQLTRHLRRAGDGPVILPGLPRAELWAEVSDYGWRELLSVARSSFALTLCDTGFCLEGEGSGLAPEKEGRNRMARAALSLSDRIVAICRADVVGVKNFLWAFQELDALADPGVVSIVLNRVQSRADRREIDELLYRHLGRRSIGAVPDGPQDFARAVQAGTSVADLRPGSEVSDSVRLLADALGGRVAARGLLARLAGRT